MRSAEARKYWKDVYKANRAITYFETITLNDCIGFTGTITFNKGITAFCGLNGVGKTTILSCIKQSLGFSKDPHIIKEKGYNTTCAVLRYCGCEKRISPDDSAVAQGIDDKKLVYVDCEQSLELLKFWSDQCNLTEYLDQFEINEFSTEQLRELSWLIGKDYSECKTIETDEEVNYSNVYFEVLLKEGRYTSLDMGLGEHFLIYIYYTLSNIENDSIFIIEEPETFISVLSQHRLMDFFAKIISKKGVSVILTTHSPHILTKLKSESIRIVGNALGKMIITIPDSSVYAKEHLGISYQNYNRKKATIFCEDYISRLFISNLLSDESPYLFNAVDIVSVDGSGGITQRLSFDDKAFMSHKFIGIYDADMRDKIKKEDIKWPYFFLPIEPCVELEIYRFLGNEINIHMICASLSIEYDKMMVSLSKREGEDHHDWLLDMCTDIGITPCKFIEGFYEIWREDKHGIINKFVNDIYNTVCESEDQLESDGKYAIV